MISPLTAPQSQSDEEAEREGDDQRHAIDDAGAAHHHRAEDHDHADGEIDAGGQDHQRLRDTERSR